ncbi:MAG: arylamine N-acetyltransferase [Erythrobacter sp.]|nr:MAG: arylamine N-acetyltransferase [Erythrobacter sp.]
MQTERQLPAYLSRIGLAQAPLPDAASLARVQAAHRQTIPFENLAIRAGGSVACDSEAVFAKLVTARRGGFCFEHNRLLADMLAAMGFDVRLLLARVLLGEPAELPPRTHCLVLVQIDGAPWIADAGFGGAYAPPMPLIDGAEAESGDGARHRLRRIGEEGTLPGSWLLERLGPLHATDGRARSESAWEKQFAFDLGQVAQADMALGCHWAATHPMSRFTQVTVASLCLATGFASLVDRELSLGQAGCEPVKRTIADVADYRTTLAQQFGLDLAAQDINRLPLFTGEC